MKPRSKKYRKSIETIVSDETSSLSDAFQKLSKFEKVNFDKSVAAVRDLYSAAQKIDPSL